MAALREDRGVVADSIKSIVDDVPDLTAEEKSRLYTVMQKAKEFDAQEENKMRQQLEGQLSKYTNVVKGWQFRWFLLNPDTGYLDYYMMDEVKRNKPRGCVHLAGAVVSPSDEDSQTFTVSAACGEVYRLRASDAKERQFWVNRLRAVAEYHTQTIAEKNPPLPVQEASQLQLAERLSPSTPSSIHHSQLPASQGISQTEGSGWLPTLHIRQASSGSTVALSGIGASGAGSGNSNNSSVTDAFRNVRDMMQQAHHCHQDMARTIENLPASGQQIHCHHEDMLVLKAVCHETLLCLDQCYSILQQQQVAANYPSGLPSGARVEWVETPFALNMKPQGKSTLGTPEIQSKWNRSRRSPSNVSSSCVDGVTTGAASSSTGSTGSPATHQRSSS